MIPAFAGNPSASESLAVCSPSSALSRRNPRDRKVLTQNKGVAIIVHDETTEIPVYIV